MKVLLLAIVLISSINATTLSLKAGWNLVGSNKDNVDVNTAMPTAKGVWLYKNNSWLLVSPNGEYTPEQISEKYNTFSILNAGDGFWVNTENDINVTLEGSFAIDTNVSVTYGWNLLSLKTDVDMNITKYLDIPSARLTWRYSNDAWEAYSASPIMNGLIKEQKIPEIETLHVGEGFWVYSNSTGYIQTPCVENKNIKSILDTLSVLDPMQESLTDSLETAKSILDSSNTNERVLAAIIEIVEVINSDEVKAFIDQNTSLPNLDALTGNIDALVDIATDASMAGGTEVMHAMAAKLKNASDIIGEAFLNQTNSICYSNATDSLMLKYNDAMMIQAAALSAAATLELFSSYTYGDTSYFRIKEQTMENNISYEYIEAEIDPLSLIRQETFFKISDKQRLANAGAMLETAVNLSSSVDTARVTLGTINPMDQEEIKRMKAALDGNGTFILDPVYNESINLQKVFSATEYIDREDFEIPTTYLGKDAIALAEYEKMIGYNEEYFEYQLSQCQDYNSSLAYPEQVSINYYMIYNSESTTPVTLDRNQSIMHSEAVYGEGLNQYRYVENYDDCRVIVYPAYDNFFRAELDLSPKESLNAVLQLEKSDLTNIDFSNLIGRNIYFESEYDGYGVRSFEANGTTTGITTGQGEYEGTYTTNANSITIVTSLGVATVISFAEQPDFTNLDGTSVKVNGWSNSDWYTAHPMPDDLLNKTISFLNTNGTSGTRIFNDKGIVQSKLSTSDEFSPEGYVYDPLSDKLMIKNGYRTITIMLDLVSLSDMPIGSVSDSDGTVFLDIDSNTTTWTVAQ